VSVIINSIRYRARLVTFHKLSLLTEYCLGLRLFVIVMQAILNLNKADVLKV